MKGSIVAAAVAVLAGSASARSHQHRHAHDLFQKRGLTTGTPQNQNETCGCTTYWTTLTGPATLYTPPVPPTTSTPPPPPPTSTLSTPATVPTPIAQTCPTPGTYTFPATTVTVTESTTVCGPSTTKVPTGTHTLGGVTTVVTTATTVTCPVATTETKSNGVVTSVIKTTTYVCPAAGTYTIAPVTVTVTKETVVCVPTVTSYAPGTYTAPAVVTTVVETDVVVYCPFTSPAPPAPVKTTSAAPPPPPAPTKEATPPPAKETKPAPKPQGTVPKLGGGDQWAITYTPYGPGGVCRTASEVSSDIAAIKKTGFNTVRVYSTDCDTLPNVGAACEEQGMKMIIGVFISQPGCDNSNPDVAHQIQAIKNWGKFNLVEMCVVGNEALHNGFCSAQQLVTLIKEVKEVLVSAGCNAPVTTTDTVAAWQGAGVAETLCPNVDVVACNSHAYFNAETTPDQAGPFVKGQLEIVKALCGNKEGYVMESGWPSKCKCNGVACCSPQDQATAISSLKETIGGSIAFFSHTDDDWKEDGECGCEKHWGCGSLF